MSILFQRDDSIDTIYSRSPPPRPNSFDSPNYNYDQPNQSSLLHQSSSNGRQSRGNKVFNIKNWKSLDITSYQSISEEDQKDVELKQYAQRRQIEHDKSQRLKLAEERYKLLQKQNDDILSTFKSDDVRKQKEFFDQSIQEITLLDTLQSAENDKVLHEEQQAREQKRQEYEKKRLIDTINSRIEYEIRQIRSKSLDENMNAKSKETDKRRSWDESSALSRRTASVADSVQIDIESSDNEEIVPSEIRDPNYRSHDTDWEVNMLADQWMQKKM